MQKLRVAVFFIFAALSMTRAQCVDFEIFINEVSKGCGSVINHTITFGEPLTFRITPTGGDIRWQTEDDIILAVTPYYTPILLEEEDKIFNYIIERNGIVKTIILNFQARRYIVSFNSNGGSAVPPQAVIRNQKASKPSPDPTREDYDFDGWDFDFNTLITGNIEIKAKWKPKPYTVRFETGGGGAIPSQTVEYGSMAAYPGEPTKTGYNFVRWELNNSPYDFSTPVTANISLTAAWQPKIYTVSFEGVTSTQQVEYNKTASELSEKPSKTGYDFDGWDFNFNTPITNDITIKAKWKAQQFTINFNAQGGTVSPSAKGVSYNEAIGTLPTPTRNAHEFKGWFNDAGTEITQTAIYTETNGITLYARWEFIKGTRPIASMLDYTLPTGLIYSCSPINPLTVSQKTDVIGTLGSITVLYGGQGTPPADAGSYAISAFIAGSEDYDSATVSLGNLSIGRKRVTLTIISATAKDKTYDAERTAEITSIYFDESPLCPNDRVSGSDYSTNAIFASSPPNVGENIEVSLVANWLSGGTLSKNYILEPASFKTVASITRATGYLFIKAPEKYELSNPVRPSIASKPSFVKNEDIIWEYKRENEAGYSARLPNRVGNWQVRATLPETDNYTGAADSVIFLVERGSATTVAHNIAFKESGFKPDSDSSSKQRNYFVTEECNIKSAVIQITVIEPEIVLYLDDIPQRGEPNEDGFIRYEIPIEFGKPGLDTLFYTLLSKDEIYSENDTILIETPIPFESITGQKWDNVLFINNNPQTNGGYEFESYKWFQNKKNVSEVQFYSAGPSSADTLNPKDIYKVTMHTTGGMRISTCEGSPRLKVPVSTAKPALTKQVLGINGKTAKTGSKVYNLKGSKTESTPAGVYIIEE